MTKPTESAKPWDIAADGLCVRCGACFNVCPMNLITKDAHLFPVRGPDAGKCTDCGLCMIPCPAHFDFQAAYKKLFNTAPEPLDAVGHVLDSFVGHAMEPAVRSAGSSGGVVSCLLRHMLKTGAVEQVLVCGMDPRQPCRATPLLTGNIDDVLAASQSKYTIVTQMEKLSEIARSGLKTAVVGLPCHIHALRKLQNARRPKADNIVLAIGLACNSTFEMEASEQLLKVCGVKPDDVARLEYRGGQWPGGVTITLRNGEVRRPRSADIKATFNYLKTFFRPSRCLTCIDFSAELADVSVMDPWIRDATGRHPYEGGWSLLLTRTDAGRCTVDSAVKSGDLHIEPIQRSMLPSQFDSIVRYKKVGASIRLGLLRAAGRPYPEYNIVFPQPSRADVSAEKTAALARGPGKWAIVRGLFVRLAFSRLGDAIMRRRDTQKRARSAAQSRHSEG
ncbi:MAG: Coenzyme F420 hydrogenase/dehydrogenase, beta subunit C-terminal domain [bacterium]